MQNATTKEVERLAALLRYGMFGGDVPAGLPQTEEEWLFLFDATRRQAVTALACDAILLLPDGMRPPRKVLFHFLSMAQTVEADNRRREKALADFAALCGESVGVPLTVVKGSSLARRYEEPLHRECGDNDLLTRADTERIAALVESAGIDVDRKDPRHITFAFKSVTFECHTCLLYHNDDPLWHRGDNILVPNLYALPAEEEAFFLAKHCEHHAVFFHNPVRLRTLIDWCMLLGSEGFDYDAFDRLKRGTDVEVFADLMTLYCQRLLGAPVRDGLGYLESKQLGANDFERLYMQCPERHPNALVRVVRRSGKYLRFSRQYRAIYGQSMFRRFYLKNLGIAVRQHL